MHLYYSASSNAFLDTRIHVSLPGDAVAITDEEHARLFAAQSGGAIIAPGEDGRPTARPIVVEAEARRERLLVAARQEAAARIAAVAPLWRQLNDVRALASTTGERRAEIERRFAAIDALRAASNRLEAALAGMTPRQLERVDVTDDIYWSTESTA